MITQGSVDSTGFGCKGYAGHVITGITIVRHDNGKEKPAEAIVDDIIENNSLEVDAISGATYSSNVIKAAVLDALTK